MRRALAVIVTFAAASSACTRDDVLSGTREPGIRLDAGFPARPDAAGARDAEPIDRGVDAGVPDSGPALPDAGPALPDAGPSCPCPTLPASCVAPAIGEPTFTPRSTAPLVQLFDTIACAGESLHVAMYETTWSCVVDAFAARLAQDPDLVVRLVVDDDQCPRMNGALECELSRIDGHPRVTILDDARSRYMHHKFLIADGRVVWVSSANFTRSSFCSDYNNSILVDQAEIVAGYEAEFQRMFTDRELGPTARSAIIGGEHTLYLGPQSPQTSAPLWFDALVSAIDTATTSVDFMIFALTRFEIGNALMAAHARGVQVRGVIAPQYVDDPVAMTLLGAGVPLKVANVHHKVLVADGRVVATGSPNWSQNAWENDEASLWIASSTVAARYRDEVARVYAGALPP